MAYGTSGAPDQWPTVEHVRLADALAAAVLEFMRADQAILGLTLSALDERIARHDRAITQLCRAGEDYGRLRAKDEKQAKRLRREALKIAELFKNIPFPEPLEEAR